MTSEPLRPDAVETVIFEPDEQAVVAVVPGALWLQAGDIAVLDDPPREARVLSSRLQLRTGQPARVLIVLDVPDAALPAGAATDTMLGADIGSSTPPEVDLDAELEQLTDEVDTDRAPRDT